MYQTFDKLVKMLVDFKNIFHMHQLNHQVYL